MYQPAGLKASARLPWHVRAQIEAQIERLIAICDADDGDIDLEWSGDELDQSFPEWRPPSDFPDLKLWNRNLDLQLGAGLARFEDAEADDFDEQEPWQIATYGVDQRRLVEAPEYRA